MAVDGGIARGHLLRRQAVANHDELRIAHEPAQVSCKKEVRQRAVSAGRQATAAKVDGS